MKYFRQYLYDHATKYLGTPYVESYPVELRADNDSSNVRVESSRVEIAREREIVSTLFIYWTFAVISVFPV